MKGKLGIYDKVLNGTPTTQEGPIVMRIYPYFRDPNQGWEHSMQIDEGTIQIDWGDGVVETLTSFGSGWIKRHKYTTPGPYILKILSWELGVLNGEMRYGGRATFSVGKTQYLDPPYNTIEEYVKSSLEILEWNNMRLSALSRFFTGIGDTHTSYVNAGGVNNGSNDYPCRFTYSAIDKPSVAKGTGSLASTGHGLFSYTVFTNPTTSKINNLDISQLDTIRSWFRDSNFNGDISLWNTSNIEVMSFVFQGSDFDNSSLSNWNTKKVENMVRMFESTNFNFPLYRNGDVWTLENCTNVDFMFNANDIFYQDLSNWCVPNLDPPGVFVSTSSPMYQSSFLPLWGTCP